MPISILTTSGGPEHGQRLQERATSRQRAGRGFWRGKVGVFGKNCKLVCRFDLNRMTLMTCNFAIFAAPGCAGFGTLSGRSEFIAAGHSGFNVAGRSEFIAAERSEFNAAERSEFNAAGRSGFNATGLSEFNVTGRSGLNVAGRSGFNAAGRSEFIVANGGGQNPVNQ